MTCPSCGTCYRIDGTGASGARASRAGRRRRSIRPPLDGPARGFASSPRTIRRRSSTPRAPPGQPRRGRQLTHSNLVYEMRGAKASSPDPAATRARSSWSSCPVPRPTCWPARCTICAFQQQGCRRIHQPTSRTWCRRSPCSSRRSWCRCPACSRRCTTPRSRTPPTTARARTRSSRWPRSTAIEWSEASGRPAVPGCCCKLKHALFDRLVYGKLRAALGGNCHASISGGAPLGARLGHFYRGVGRHHLRGLRTHRDQRGDHRQPRSAHIKVGSVGKLLPGNSMRDR